MPWLDGVIVEVQVMSSEVTGALADPVPAVKAMSDAPKVAGLIGSENVMVME